MIKTVLWPRCRAWARACIVALMVGAAALHAEPEIRTTPATPTPPATITVQLAVGTDTATFSLHLPTAGCVSIIAPVEGRNHEERLFGPTWYEAGHQAIRLPAGRIRARQGRIEVFTVALEPAATIGRQGAGEREFVHPTGIGWDSTMKELYVADTGNDRIIRLDASGRFIAQYGGFGVAFGDRGEEREDSLSEPMDVCLGGFSNLYITDYNNNRVVEFDAYRKYVGPLYPKPTDRSQRLNRPHGITVDRENAVWVVDGRADRVLKLTPSGAKLLELGGFGYSREQFHDPTQVAVTDDGKVFVADRGNKRIQVFDRLGHHIMEIKDGFQAPVGVAIDPDGLLLIADERLDKIGLYTDTGHPLARYSGLSKTDRFRSPTDFVALPDRVFVLDSGNHRLCVMTRERRGCSVSWQAPGAVLD